MLETSKLEMTVHSKRRFKERFEHQPDLSLEDSLRSYLESAHTANKKQMRRIREACPKHRHLANEGSGWLYAVKEGRYVFIFEPLGVAHYLMRTCFDFEKENEPDEESATSV